MRVFFYCICLLTMKSHYIQYQSIVIYKIQFLFYRSGMSYCNKYQLYFYFFYSSSFSSSIKTFFNNLYSSLSSPNVFLKYSKALLVLSFIIFSLLIARIFSKYFQNYHYYYDNYWNSAKFQNMNYAFK